MAGIGFQLKKLIDSQDSYFHKIRAYTYSLLVIYAPLIICIFCINFIQGIMSFFNVEKEGAMLFSKLIGYIFSASNVTTGVLALILTRYVSDAIYLKDNKKVMPSVYGGIVATLIPGMLIYWAGLFYFKIDLIFSILTGVFFGLINITWLLLIYLSALSNHRKILKIFILGTAIILVSLVFSGIVGSKHVLYYIIMSMNLGFTIIASLLFLEIKNYFGDGDGELWEFTKYIKKYPSLIFINVFYILGMYFEGFYIEIYKEVKFLEIVYIGAFVLIPGMMYFIIRFETSYFEKHNLLFKTINKMGTYEDIALAKENLINLVKFEMKMLFRAVFIFTFIIMFLGIQYFMAKGATENTIISFSLFALGMCFTLLMYVVKVLFLYFDLRKNALIITTIFFTLNIILVIFETSVNISIMGFRVMGFGIMGAALISLVIGIISLKNFFRNLDYYLFKVG